MGLSPRNLWDMKKFYLRYYQEDIKLRQLVAVLPWGHNFLLMDYKLSAEHVLFYANEIISKNWSRNMLLLALKSEYHLSIQASEKSNNFAVTMSEENAIELFVLVQKPKANSLSSEINILFHFIFQKSVSFDADFLVRS